MYSFSVDVIKNIVISSLIVSVIALLIGFTARELVDYKKEAVLIGLVCSGWLFYPVYWFCSRKNRKTYQQNLQAKKTQIVEKFLLTHSDSYNESLDTKWLNILKATFSPDNVKKVHDPLPKEKIINMGDNLCVPLLNETEYKYCFSQAEQGKRKFLEQDIETVKFLRQLLKLSDEIIQSQKSLLFKERKQLAKDIHDDLSAKLLSILRHSTSEQKPMVMEALTDLRNILNQLDVNEVHLQEVFGDIRLEMKSRVAFYDATFVWDVNIPDAYNVKVNAQVNSNLRRIFREATTNALKYMDNERIESHILIDKQGFLSINISNFGTFIPHEYGSGKGLSNIVTRADAINGHVNWVKQDDRFTVSLLINLELINQPNDS